jgi:hypothetical protein
MKYTIQKIRIEADSLYTIIDNWNKMTLEVRNDSAVLSGDGFAYDIAEAFNTLILEWEAEVALTNVPDELHPGKYELMEKEGTVYAVHHEERYEIEDQDAVVLAESGAVS